MSVDAADERLIGLSVAELEALADGLLAPARQARPDELLAANAAGLLGGADGRELDRLLDLSDPLTVLKGLARYTLGQLKLEAAAP
jgi:hypothetical protein